MDDTYKLYKSSKEYPLWPIKEEKFTSILYGKDDISNETQVFKEEINGKLAGFISVKAKVIEGVKKGSVVFIFVDEAFRGKGVGHKLLQSGLNWFKNQRVHKIKFGGNAGSYFWPAVPENLPQLKKFLKKENFTLSEGPVDMFADITGFTTPTNVYNALEENGVVIEYANEEYKDSIIKFAKENFSQWYEYYLEDLTKGKFDKVFYAHKGDEIVAISELWVRDSNWDLLFENNVGGGGALGVAEKWRGKGIGLAMKTWGTEILKEEDIKYVWISWTSSIGFYEKLGFRIWRRYNNARLSI
ncbi:GNAT family N-acetyltransferase [Candidatus Microgenomates bacterium]|nr:MAG: GNAT family N-acetyltransferase [Candidatus Microgenomates bacterium]